MEGTYKKSKGNAGLEGVQFQLDLLIVFALNALRSCKDWKISSENEEAGKYDDLVLELPGKSVFLQAKFKQTKKITRDQLFSSNSKNADFSLPKYFFSYLEIRMKSEVEETTVILCTNTDVNPKGLLDDLTSHRANSDSLLYCDGATCPYFSFNKNILPRLRKSAESYLANNLLGKGFDKAQITAENMEDFLRNFHFFYNYPSGEELHRVIERLLQYLGDLWSRTTYHEIYRKVEEWFKHPKGEYLTPSRTNAMLCEIRSEQYCSLLKNYNISFEHSNFDFSNSNRIIHVNAKRGCLLEMLQLFQVLHGDKAKQLFVNPDDTEETQKHMVEAFGLPRYAFLIMVWPTSCDGIEKLEISSKLRQILEKHQYKKLVLLTEGDVEVLQLFGLADITRVDGSVTFQDFSKNSRDRLLKTKNIIFQGERISLEELLKTQAADYCRKSLDSGMLQVLVKGEDVEVGRRLLDLDEEVARYYVHRMFEREIEDNKKINDPISEERLFDVIEKVVLISDTAGTGKTTALIKMAAYIKQTRSRAWVIRINLIDYTRILRDFLRKKRETVTLEELLNSQEATKFKNEFEESLFLVPGKVVLLLDGVDEIAPNYTLLILNLLQQCKEATNIAKVLATTRPHLTGELRSVLNVESFKMLPFSRQNQIGFLINYWTHNLQLQGTDERTGKCAQYAEVLIDKMSSWAKLNFYEENSIVAIPLQVRMIADIFQDKNMWNSDDWESCREFLNAIDREPKLPEKFDISKLYDMFIEKKWDVLVDKGNPTGNTIADQALMDQFEEYLSHHRSLALKIVLTENSRNLFSTYQESDSSRVLKMGIVQKNGDNVFFIHRTFAEYFVAASILQELQLNPSVEFQRFLIDEILVEYKFIVIRGFLNNCLQKVIDSIPSNIFAKYQSCTCDANLNLIFSLAMDGRVSILQLILKSVNFRTIRDKIVNVRDLQIDSGEGTMNTLNYLEIITREDGVNIRDQHGKTPLYYAAEHCHLDTVKFLINHGADPNIGSKDDRTPLLVAVVLGDFNTVKCLVEHGAFVNYRDHQKATALHWAAVMGRLKIAKYLVKRGSNVSDRTVDDEFVLHWATGGEKLNVVKYIVECGGNINGRDRAGRTALHWAAEAGELDVIKYIVKSGASVNDRDSYGCTALHWAVAMGQLDTAKYVVECGASVNDKSSDGRTALHWAADGGELDVIKYIVECRASLDDRDYDGRTALYWAVMRGQLDAIKYMVESGANVNDRCSRSRTVLHWAATRGQLDVIKFVVKCEANINDKDRNGNTALHWAAMIGHLHVVKYLVECGANVNDRSSDDRTALHWTLMSGYLDVIKYVVESGASVNDRDGDGRTALHLAAEGDKLNVVKYIVECGASVNDRSSDGRTALHWAVIGGQLDIIKYIVGCGVNIDARDGGNRTALDWATKREELDVIKYMVECGASINDRSSDDCTALQWVGIGGQLDEIKHLVKCGANVDDP